METPRGSPTSTWVSWKFGYVAVNAANLFVAFDVVEPVEQLPQNQKFLSNARFQFTHYPF